MSGICAGEPGCASATAETPLMTATRAPRCSVLDPLHSQTSATNATISDATGTFTITDDDATPSLSINDVSTSDESNTSTNMTVTLSAAAGRDVTVDYATSNGTATAG